MVSDNGTEQRVELLEVPKRTFSHRYTFDTVADIRRELRSMFLFGQSLWLPLFAYQTSLTSGASSSATSLSFAAALTDMRDLGELFLFDTAGGEFLSIDTVGASATTLLDATSRAYAAGSLVAPAVEVYNFGSGSMGRFNPDDVATASLSFRELAFTYPFLHSFNEEELDTLDGLPILDRRPVGTDFDEDWDTGRQLIDFGGVVSIRDNWSHAQVEFGRRYRCARLQDPADWNWWRAFADYAKGSCNPFYTSTYREDFPVDTAPSLGGTTFKWEGAEYLNDYFPHETFKGVAIETAAGTHYAQVTDCTLSSGDSLVTFSPALPGSAGWNVDVRISMLLLCRLADDVIDCQHGKARTYLEMTLRTVDA